MPRTRDAEDADQDDEIVYTLREAARIAKDAFLLRADEAKKYAFFPDDQKIDREIVREAEAARDAWDELADRLAENFSSGKSDDEADSDLEIARPEEIEDDILHFIGRISENARVYKKLLKACAFDREQEERIGTAIDGMIQKWRSARVVLK